MWFCIILEYFNIQAFPILALSTCFCELYSPCATLSLKFSISSRRNTDNSRCGETVLSFWAHGQVDYSIQIHTHFFKSGNFTMIWPLMLQILGFSQSSPSWPWQGPSLVSLNDSLYPSKYLLSSSSTFTPWHKSKFSSVACQIQWFHHLFLFLTSWTVLLLNWAPAWGREAYSKPEANSSRGLVGIRRFDFTRSEGFWNHSSTRHINQVKFWDRGTWMFPFGDSIFS